MEVACPLHVPVGISPTGWPGRWAIVVKLGFVLEPNAWASAVPDQDQLSEGAFDGEGRLVHPTEFGAPRHACDVVVVGSVLATPGRCGLRVAWLRKAAESPRDLGPRAPDRDGSFAPSDQRLRDPAFPLEIGYESRDLVVASAIHGPLPSATLIDPGAWAPPSALALTLEAVLIDPVRGRAWLLARGLVDGDEALLDRATLVLDPRGLGAAQALEGAQRWPRYRATRAAAAAARQQTMLDPRELAAAPSGLPFEAAPRGPTPEAPATALPFVGAQAPEAEAPRRRPLMTIGGTPLAYPPTPFANRRAAEAEREPPLGNAPAAPPPVVAQSPIDRFRTVTIAAIGERRAEVEAEPPSGATPPAPPPVVAESELDRSDTLTMAAIDEYPSEVEVEQASAAAPPAPPAVVEKTPLQRFETVTMAVVDEHSSFDGVLAPALPFGGPSSVAAASFAGTQSTPLAPVPPAPAPPAPVVPTRAPEPATPSIVAVAVQVPSYVREELELTHGLSIPSQPANTASQEKRIEGKSLREVGRIRSALWAEPDRRRAILRTHGLSELRWRVVERAWSKELGAVLQEADRMSEAMSTLRAARAEVERALPPSSAET